jgi:tetratricopeptide (TPR) repeat protein
MNSDSNDTVTTCWSCKKKPATTTYTNRRGTLSELVCAPCLDLLHLREEFEWGICETQDLAEQERYDEILAWLDAFEEANCHRDQDNWLAREIAAHRAFTFWEAERYAESLEACEKREQLGFEDVWQRWAAGGAKAQALEGLGRHQEALAVFEEAFSHQDPQHLRSAAYFLRVLVEFSANAGHEKWRSVAEAVAEEYGVEMPARESLRESMLALAELTCGKRPDEEPEAEHG